MAFNVKTDVNLLQISKQNQVDFDHDEENDEKFVLVPCNSKVGLYG